MPLLLSSSCICLLKGRSCLTHDSSNAPPELTSSRTETSSPIDSLLFGSLSNSTVPAAICHDKSSNAFFEASTSFADPPSKRSPAPLSASNNPMASLDSFRNVLDHASRHRNNLRHSKSHIVWCPRSTEATCNVVDTGDDEQSLKRACSLSEFSTLGVHLLESLQNHFTSQPDVTRGPSTNERLLVSLRATRSQLSRVSRSLREQSATNTSLRKELQAERAARFSAEKTLANITIGKKLFVEQVSSLSELTLDLQADTSIAVMNPESHMQTYSPATEISLRKVLQPYGASSASSPLMSDRTGPYDQRYSTLEDFDRPECSSLNHSLLKQRCETLSAKVSSFQANMMTCLDECAAALELERHLRYEVEGRLRVCEMQSLKCDMKPLEQTIASMEPPTNSSTESSDHFHQLNLITTASFGRCDALERENLEQRDIIRDLSQQLAGYAERVQKLTRENKKANIEHQKQWSKIFGNAPIGLTRIHQIQLIKEAIDYRMTLVTAAKGFMDGIPLVLLRHPTRLSKIWAKHSVIDNNSLVTPSTLSARLRHINLV